MTPQDKHNALVRAVLKNPADDGIRLVYADFLQEFGDPLEQVRGQFIALQMSLWQRGWREAMPGETSIPGPHNERRWYDEAKGMLRDHGVSWLYRESQNAGLIQHTLGATSDYMLIDSGCSLAWRRGFVEQISVSWQVWLKWHKAFLKVWPITRVNLTGEVPSSEVYYRTDPDSLSLDGKRWVKFGSEHLTIRVALKWVAKGWPRIRFSAAGAE